MWQNTLKKKAGCIFPASTSANFMYFIYVKMFGRFTLQRFLVPKKNGGKNHAHQITAQFHRCRRSLSPSFSGVR